jgi:Zn-dependent protease/predicted transcriptional regulator
MRWSWRLGTLFGITVYIHGTVVLLLAALFVLPLTTGGDPGTALRSVLFLALAFACIVLHEFGHALTARHFGVQTRDITLYPIGGIARLERIPRDPHHEFWISLAGPAVNVAIALVLLLVTGGAPLAWDLEGHLQATLATQLMWANAALAAFNLIPAFPMDGGRVLRAYLAERMDYARATRIAAAVGQGMAFLFGFVGLIFNPSLLFVAFFVYVGASEEAAAVQTDLAFEGVSVREAMITDFTVLAAGDPLAHAVQLLLTGSQQDFPVVVEGQVVGVLRRAALMTALATGGLDTPVADAMEPTPAAVNPGECVRTALQRMDDESQTTLPVLERERLIGLITLENLSEYLMVRAALTRRKVPAPAPGAA